MPLVRFQVRNEYGLGTPELYNGANRDDPKAILDGVAVSGLVGILRQLGDLTEFAAEVFHGLQEQLLATASRSHKMMVRVRNIEEALPPLEKSITAQKNHIHFAYTTGFDWHVNIQTEQNHLNSYLPQYILDSYEDCRDPPRLHLLDKFDTGGPGACFKRYSDPSYFKRVMTNPELENAEKVQREKKVHKNKKKGLRQKNGEILHTVSISRCNGRAQLASPSIYRQSPCESITNINAGPKYDLENPSFGSRTRLRVQSNNAHSSIVPDEQDEVLDDDFPHGSLQVQSAPKSSCVTWDEKTEIMEPTFQQCDSIVNNQDEDLELLPSSSYVSTLEKVASLGNVDPVNFSFGDENMTDETRADSSLRNMDGEDISFGDENIPDAIHGENQIDEIGSEPDNYVDALNTMESEIDTDIECQTKREVELPSSNLKGKENRDGAGLMHEMTTQNSDSSDLQSHTASYNSHNKEMSENFSNVDSVEVTTHVQPPPNLSTSANMKVSENTDLYEHIDSISVSRVNSFEVVSGPSPPSSCILNSQAQLSDNIINKSSKFQESYAEVSGAPLVQFWTNGGLLGLEPSKPPDFNVSNISNQNIISASKETIRPISHSDSSSGKLDTLIKTPEQREKNLNSVGEKYGPHGTSNPTDLPDELIRTGNEYQTKTTDPTECSTYCHNKQNNDMFRKDSLELPMTGNSVMTTGAELPVASEVKAPSGETSQENIKSTSTVFSLGHKLLVNGFQKKLQEPICHEQKKGQLRVAHQTSPDRTIREKQNSGSFAYSLPSSPPLEHMKISFHAINNSETSKLRLKFPDRHCPNEDIRDHIFASFQLLPEPAIIPQRDSGSESDDDTFCRSSPYMPDDLSHCSESNSEQWESGEMPGNKDHELYDALHRVSSAESISSSFELDGASHGNMYPNINWKNPDIKDGERPFHLAPSLDLPSLDSLDPSIDQKERKSDSEQNHLPDSRLQNPHEPPPPPPPLPPLQWCVVKPHPDVVEDNRGTLSEVNTHPNNLHILQNKSSQPTVPAPPKLPHIKEAIVCPPNNKDQQKLNGCKESRQDGHIKEVDEREDLLQQIRAKSFNLRRTTSTRPNFSPGPTTNVKVAAILEKANAIRQAFVGSDEGGDDNWSDD
ncbi:PREDICTED: SCAR-like protein 2 isoform X2 [Nelumbo nucifera]|uniref:Protein SCAR n=1 Tax=Nelumbo nucifera TaxID=4432 RepID=A0A1U8BG62_NELNU|nr:PREDICTED: SCAR-like protein 2 isoform X2 [Nelumbo nucifera]